MPLWKKKEIRAFFKAFEVVKTGSQSGCAKTDFQGRMITGEMEIIPCASFFTNINLVCFLVYIYICILRQKKEKKQKERKNVL